MIHIVDNGIIWEERNAQIIFNPVSTFKGKVGREVFNKLLMSKYRKVYEEYTDYMVGESAKRLLGDIQLVQIDKNKLVMNGFVYKGKELDLVALSKALVELYNLAREYELNVAIPIKMNCDNIITNGLTRTIIDTIFNDFEYNAYLYSKTPYRL